MKRRSLAVVLVIAAIMLAVTKYAVESHRVPLREKATSVVVVKSEHKLLLLSRDRVIRSYNVAVGRGGHEPKQRQGDHRTPEGQYVIDRRKSNSRFHRALHISYPNDSDRERARRLGVEPGGDIMIHGIQNGLGWMGPLHRMLDWTDGCIAVTDGEIEEIWAAVPDGTPVEIRR
jgi:murein L,D-transpeptidase YafK